VEQEPILVHNKIVVWPILSVRSLYATFGAVPSRPSGFNLGLIMVFFAVKLFSSFAG